MSPSQSPTLQGSIGTFALPEILLLLSRSGASGRLKVTRDGIEETFWFDQGQVRGTDQMQETVLDVLHWDAGTFQFEARKPVAPEADAAVSVEGLLMESGAPAVIAPRRPPRLDPALTKDLLIKLMSGIEKL
jgi:hypothetical protein